MRTVIPMHASLVPKDAKRVFKGIIYDTYQWQQKMYDGSYKTFEMLKRPDTLKVIAIKDNKIVVTEQEQPGDELFYDLPGGRNDQKNETELEGTKRELLEETGMTFKTWKLIDVRQPAPKVEQFVYIFLATDFISQVKQNLDSGEKIKVEMMTLEQIKNFGTVYKVRYMPKHIFDNVSTIHELIDYPGYK